MTIILDASRIYKQIYSWLRTSCSSTYVWPVGSSSSFHALNKHRILYFIYIYPVPCVQYYITANWH
uniref:Uncharacterized protein n=1 Tax=Oryza brachyantha TaxID=4533 RepID=J3L764_ORYBR